MMIDTVYVNLTTNQTNQHELLIRIQENIVCS